MKLQQTDLKYKRFAQSTITLNCAGSQLSFECY